MTKPKILQNKAEQIKRQLYGKQYSLSNLTSGSSFKKTSKSVITPESIDESKFLRKDLFKIFILSTLAFALQFSLYFALQRKLINLNFFKLI